MDVKRVYIDVADGDDRAGRLLSQLVYRFQPLKDGNLKSWGFVIRESRRWFCLRRVDWWDECRLTPRMFDRAVSVLTKLVGVVEKRIFRLKDGSTVVALWLDFETLVEKLCALGVLMPEVDDAKATSDAGMLDEGIPFSLEPGVKPLQASHTKADLSSADSVSVNPAPPASESGSLEEPSSPAPELPEKPANDQSPSITNVADETPRPQAHVNDDIPAGSVDTAAAQDAPQAAQRDHMGMSIDEVRALIDTALRPREAAGESQQETLPRPQQVALTVVRPGEKHQPVEPRRGGAGWRSFKAWVCRLFRRRTERLCSQCGQGGYVRPDGSCDWCTALAGQRQLKARQARLRRDGS